MPPRVSNYTIGYPIPGQEYFILLHGYTGAVDKVARDLGSRLVANRGQVIGDALWFSKLSDDLVQLLHQRGYVTTDSFDEEVATISRIARAIHERDLQLSPTGFLLVPSYQCNLRCPYCFQSHDMHAGAGRFARMMSTEQVDQAFAIIDRFDRPGAVGRALGRLPPTLSDAESAPVVTDYDNRIGLFGGEPLARICRPIVECILEQANRRGKALSAITNGVELDCYQDLLGKGRIEKLQITLDGNREQHDQRRVGPGYRNTFDLILRNTEAALGTGIEVAIRINVDSRNPSASAELASKFAELGWTRFPNFWAYAAAVHPPRPVSVPFSQSNLVDRTMQQNGQSQPELSIESYEKTAQAVLGQALGGSGYPFPRAVNCAAETGLLIFDPLGDVYACWEDIGYAEHRIGRYDGDGLNLNESAGQWLDRFPGNIEECISCPYALIHVSGCAAHARKRTGSVMSSACESFKEYFPKTLAHVYSRFEQNLRARSHWQSEPELSQTTH